MLRCQLALLEAEQKRSRIRSVQDAINRKQAISMTPEEKRFEEQKRERRRDPVLRWKVLQETMTFVDSQQKVPRNSKESCLKRQQAFDARGAEQSK
jgi:hypothetical protein